MDLEWAKNRITVLRFWAKDTGMMRIQVPPDAGIARGDNCRIYLTDGILELHHRKGKVYEIRFTDPMGTVVCREEGTEWMS